MNETHTRDRIRCTEYKNGSAVKVHLYEVTNVASSKYKQKLGVVKTEMRNKRVDLLRYHHGGGSISRVNYLISASLL